MSGNSILLLNGPNLSRLGKREPEIYGHQTLADINRGVAESFPELTVECFQSEHEGLLIEKLFECEDFGFCWRPRFVIFCNYDLGFGRSYRGGYFCGFVYCGGCLALEAA